MLSRILVCYDSGEESQRALEFAIRLSNAIESSSSPTEIHLVHVIEKPRGIADPVPDEAMDSILEAGMEILSNGARTVKKQLGNPITHLEIGAAPDKILELADKIEPELIVIGIAKHPASERIMGTVSTVLFKTRKYAVLAVP